MRAQARPREARTAQEEPGNAQKGPLGASWVLPGSPRRSIWAPILWPKASDMLPENRLHFEGFAEGLRRRLFCQIWAPGLEHVQKIDVFFILLPPPKKNSRYSVAT